MLQFQQGGDLSGVLNQISVSYTVMDAGGSVVAQEVRPIDNPRVVFSPPSNGEVRVDAQIVNSSGEALGAVQSTMIGLDGVQAVAAEAPVEVAAAAETEVQGRIAFQRPDCQSAPRTGHGYPVVGQLSPGSELAVTGKNEGNDWWQIDLDGTPAWVIGQLVNTAERLVRLR